MISRLGSALEPGHLDIGEASRLMIAARVMRIMWATITSVSVIAGSAMR
jgi:hypothetical protein